MFSRPSLSSNGVTPLGTLGAVSLDVFGVADSPVRSQSTWGGRRWREPVTAFRFRTVVGRTGSMSRVSGKTTAATATVRRFPSNPTRRRGSRSSDTGTGVPGTDSSACSSICSGDTAASVRRGTSSIPSQRDVRRTVRSFGPATGRYRPGASGGTSRRRGFRRCRTHFEPPR